MGQGAENHFDRLSPRMRECLRLAYNRKTNKEIAASLSVEEGTVKGYIAEAVRLLGARGKVHAAELFHSHEGEAPSVMAVPSGGVPDAIAPLPSEAQPSAPWWRNVPLRLPGASANDLSLRQRLLWIILIAIGIPVAVSAVAGTLRFINDIVAGR